MFQRFLAICLVCGCFCIVPPARADVILGISNTGNGYSGDPGEIVDPDGFLDFSLNPFAPPQFDPQTPTNASLFNYSFGGDPNEVFGDFVNGSINYDLDVNINDTVDGDLGTVDITGSANGGVSGGDPVSNTFINDIVTVVKVNNVNIVVGFDPAALATFSIARLSGGFLNFTLFDPNPDFDRGNAGPGLKFDVSQTPDALFQQIDPLPRAGVPEPGTGILWATVAAVAVFMRRRRRTTNGEKRTP